MAQQQTTLDFLVAAHVAGMEEMAKLINRVDALEKATRSLQSANQGLTKSTDEVIRNGKRYNNALDEQSKRLRQQRQGTQQLNMQIGDFFTSVSTGASPMQAFNQQLGQVGYAMSQMGGKAGALGDLLQGPLGIAILIATMALGPFIDKLFGAEEASRSAALAANQLETEQSGVAAMQSALGQMFDISTGKITNNTAQVRLNTLAMILNNQEKARALALEGRKVMDAASAGKKPLLSFDFGLFMSGKDMARQSKNLRDLSSFAQSYRSGALSAEKALMQVGKLDLRGTGLDLTSLRQSILDTENAKALGAATGDAMKAFETGIMSSNLIKPDKPRKEREKTISELDKLREAQKKIIDQFEAGALSPAEFEKQLKAVTAAYKEGVNPAEEYLKKFNEQDQALKTFMTTANSLVQKQLPDWEQKIISLNEQYEKLVGTTRLTADVTAAHGKAIEATLLGPINNQIEKYDEMIAKANGVTDSFAATSAAIVARAVAEGVSLEEINARLDVLKQKMADFKIAERNEEIRKSYEAIGNSVSSAFQGMLTGASSWKDGMKGIINSVIDELWRLYVVQQIVGFVTRIAGGGASAATAARLSGDVTSTMAANPSLFANGTVNAPGGMAIVGERGPELINLPRGSQVIPAHRAQNMMGGGVTVNVDARGSADPAAVRAQVQAGIMQAAPAIIAAAEARTVAGLRRPRLGGVMQ